MDNLPFDLEKPVARKHRPEEFGDELARIVTVSIRDLLLQHWPEVRAVEIAVEDAREEFDGEDPLHPQVRQLLDAAKQTLVKVHRDVAPFVGEIALPEPEQDLANVRLLIEKSIEKG